MPYTLPTPTGSSIRELHEKLTIEWNPRFSVDLALRDLVHQRNVIEILPDSDDRNIESVEIHSGRPGGIIEHATGLLMAGPGWHVEPLDLTTDAKRDAETIETALAHVFQDQLVKNDFWTSVGRDILIFGRAFVLAMPLPSVWTIQEGYPVQRKKESAKDFLMRIREFKESEGKFPFVIKHVPVLSILPLLDSMDNVLATIEEKWVPAKVLAEEMESAEVKEALERRTIKWYDELPVVEYIDCEHVAYFLAGTTPRRDRQIDMPLWHGLRSYKLLRTWKHGLGKHPMVLISGIKTEVVDDYTYHWKGFLEDAYDAFVTYDRILSRLATMVYAYYLPSYEWKIPVTTAQFQGRERPPMEVNLGGVTVTYQDETLKPLDIQANLPPADLLLQSMDDIIQRATLEDVLFGRVQGAAPAFQVNLRIQVAKSKLSSISGHMGSGLVGVGERLLRGIEQLGEAMLIGNQKITTKMAMSHKNRISVNLEPKNPVERNQDIGAAEMALGIGLPWDWVMEKILNIENPALLRLQKDILEIEQLPQVKEQLMADALEQLDILVNENEYTPVDELPIDQLTPELQQVLEQLQQEQATGGAPNAGDEDIVAQLQSMLAGNAEGEAAGGTIDRGPWPEGAAPTSLVPRGLMTPKEQPQPGSVQTGTDMLGQLGNI